MTKTITIADDVAEAKGRIEGELLKRRVRATYSDIFRAAIEIAGDEEIVEKVEKEAKRR